MAYRMCATANKIPTTLAGDCSNLCDQSYLLLSPVEHQKQSSSSSPEDSDEPDIRRDDVTFLRNRDLNAGISTAPQPRFGIPVGPVTGGANSDYLHAVPRGRYRSTFHPMRTPDVVKDDLAFRELRKDSNQSDPNDLGIVKDPNGIILPRRAWPFSQSSSSSRSSPLLFYSDYKHGKAMRSLSEGITDIIKKQSSNPSGEVDSLISYPDVVDISIENSRKSGSSSCSRKSRKNANRKSANSRRSHSAGRTVFDLLRFQEDDEEENDRSLSDTGETTINDITVDKCDLSDKIDSFSIDEGVVLPTDNKSNLSANTSVCEDQDDHHDLVADATVTDAVKADHAQLLETIKGIEDFTPELVNTINNSKEPSTKSTTIKSISANASESTIDHQLREQTTKDASASRSTHITEAEREKQHNTQELKY